MLPFFNMKMMLPFFNMKFFPVIFEFEQQSMIMLQPLQLECLGDVGSPPSAQFALRPPPPPPPPPSLVMRAKPFFRTFMELLVGVIFFRQDLKTPYIKNSECDSQAKKKKKDSNCSFYNFSLLVPCHSKFMAVCICILIFHGVYYPNHKYFFVGD